MLSGSSGNKMQMVASRADIIARLQRDILPLQGFKPAANTDHVIKLGPIGKAFPNGVFPLGAVHEFVSYSMEDTAATGGFITGVIGQLMQQSGVTIWISPACTVFPPALTVFGVQPDKIIFLDLEKETDRLWAMEEALRCEGIAAVVCETQHLGFTASRRFQLAVEQSGTTGFILRRDPRKLVPNACIARWRITSLNSRPEEGMPGPGYPRWNVDLLKARNGKAGSWQIEFAEQQFKHIYYAPVIQEQTHKKTG